MSRHCVSFIYYFACYLAICLLCPELAPQVSLGLERKADEPFATLRLITQTPAAWILNFRVRVYIRKADEPFATLRLITKTPAVWVERVDPGPSVYSITRHRKDYLVRDSLFACYLAI